MVTYYPENEISLGLASGHVGAAKMLKIVACSVLNSEVFHLFLKESMLPEYRNLPVLTGQNVMRISLVN